MAIDSGGWRLANGVKKIFRNVCSINNQLNRSLKPLTVVRVVVEVVKKRGEKREIKFVLQLNSNFDPPPLHILTACEERKLARSRSSYTPRRLARCGRFKENKTIRWKTIKPVTEQLGKQKAAQYERTPQNCIFPGECCGWAERVVRRGSNWVHNLAHVALWNMGLTN